MANTVHFRAQNVYPNGMLIPVGNPAASGVGRLGIQEIVVA
jgi:hypothetical protein